MEKQQLKNIIEAVLMANDSPLTVSDLLKLFESDPVQPERSAVREILTELQTDYDGRGIELVEVASGFRVQARKENADWINRLFDERPARYSRALLETLAIIAYRQPITRSEIEEIRGVSVSSSITKTLQERDWIRVVGHRDVPGKPSLLATTKEFLDYFNLKKLSELPSLAEIKDFDQMNPDLFEGMDMEALRKAVEADSEPVEQDEVESIDEPGGDDDDSESEETDNVIPFTG